MSMPPLRVLIVDDEPLARERTRRLLERLGGVEVLGECANGREALESLEKEAPDVLLLDINMPELDGLRLIEALDDPPAIILATAYEHHALRAFELEVTDYLLKPFSAERLGKALSRVRKQLGGDTQETIAAASEPVRLPVDTGRGIELVSSRELSGACIEEGVVFLLRADGERLCFAGTLQELEKALPASDFLRASRRALVHLAAIERFESNEDGSLSLYLSGGHQEQVSRRRARFFRMALKCP